LVHTQYTVSPLFTVPTVTTVHDISFLIEPRWFPLKDRILLRLTVPASCHRAKRVLTVSETSREDMIQMLHLPPEKVVATPNGLPEGFYPIPKAEAQGWVRENYGVEPPFALAVGVLQPRKNWQLAIEAVYLARREYELPITLVLTGKAGWARRELERAKQTFAPDGWLIETGYVPDEHLVWLYNAAEMLLYPSFYEGVRAAAVGGDGVRNARNRLQRRRAARSGRLWGHPAPAQRARHVGKRNSHPADQRRLPRGALPTGHHAGAALLVAHYCRAHLASLPAGSGCGYLSANCG
jgi:hypothetical protein